MTWVSRVPMEECSQVRLQGVPAAQNKGSSCEPERLKAPETVERRSAALDGGRADVDEVDRRGNG